MRRSLKLGRISAEFESADLRTTAKCALPSGKQNRRKAETLEPASKREHWVLIPFEHCILARPILVVAARDDSQRIIR
jgi:hypothetical protein